MWPATLGWNAYATLLAVALAAASRIVFVAGVRVGLPRAAWRMCTAAWVTGGIVGSALLSAAVGEPGGRTLIGGFAGSIVGLTMAALALRVPAGIALGSVTVAMPVGAAIARLGCFLAGCCSGTPTSAPWAVAYGPGTAAFREQVDRGWIAPDAEGSLFAHPVQLYDALLSALLAATLAWGPLRRRDPATRVAVMIAGLALIRLATQWVRIAHDGGVAPDSVQWAMLVVAAAALAFLLRHSPNDGHAVASTPTAGVRTTAQPLVAATVALVACAAVAFTGATEALALVLAAAAALHAAVVPRGRAGATAPAVALLLQAGQPAVDRLPPDEIEFGFTRLSTGYVYQHTSQRWVPPSDECVSTPGHYETVTDYTREHHVVLTGLGVSRRQYLEGSRSLTIRGFAAAGYDAADAPVVYDQAPANTQAQRTTVAGGGGSFQYQGSLFGFTAGGLMMSGRRLSDETQEVKRAASGTMRVTAALRIGPPVGPFFEGGAASPAVTPGAPGFHHVGLGLALRGGHELRAGMSEQGQYVGGRAWLTPNIGVSAMTASDSAHGRTLALGALTRLHRPPSYRLRKPAEARGARP